MFIKSSNVIALFCLGFLVPGSANAFFCKNFFGKSSKHQRPPVYSPYQAALAAYPPMQYAYQGPYNSAVQSSVIASEYPEINPAGQSDNDVTQTSANAANGSQQQTGTWQYPGIMPRLPVYPVTYRYPPSRNRFCFFN